MEEKENINEHTIVFASVDRDIALVQSFIDEKIPTEDLRELFKRNNNDLVSVVFELKRIRVKIINEKIPPNYVGILTMDPYGELKC
jgi:hypothetical protein